MKEIGQQRSFPVERLRRGSVRWNDRAVHSPNTRFHRGATLFYKKTSGIRPSAQTRVFAYTFAHKMRAFTQTFEAPVYQGVFPSLITGRGWLLRVRASRNPKWPSVNVGRNVHKSLDRRLFSSADRCPPRRTRHASGSTLNPRSRSTTSSP